MRKQTLVANEDRGIYKFLHFRFDLFLSVLLDTLTGPLTRPGMSFLSIWDVEND
jgi:hypothetical protein